MSTQLLTLVATETVSLAEQLMRSIEARHLPGCLPVVDDERLVGLITERDLVDVLISGLGGEEMPPSATPQA
ncbi:MAG: CBS domain-containing protein [Myxococcota bacterium]